MATRRCHRAVLLPLLLAAACATPIDLPAGFVRLGDAGEGLRAASSDDARLWVRDLYDDTEGPLEFWAERLRLDLVERRGHQFVAKGAIGNRDGAEGRWFEFVANVDGERIGYLIALWVAGRRLRVVEFAARAEVFTQRVDAVRAALATVRS